MELYTIEAKVSDKFRYVLGRLGRLPLHEEVERVFYIGSKGVTYPHFLREIPNSHPRPAEAFRAAYTEKQKIIKRGWAPVGLIHTHPDPERPEPSSMDVDMARRSSLIYFGVYQPLLRRLTWYTGTGAVYVTHLKHKIRRTPWKKSSAGL